MLQREQTSKHAECESQSWKATGSVTHSLPMSRQKDYQLPEAGVGGMRSDC